MSALGILKVAIQVALTGTVLALIGWTIYFVMNRTDKSKAPSDKWPEWYRKLVHVYPKEYNKTSSNVIVTGTQSELFSATTPSKCADDPKKGCSKDEECVGFVFTKTDSNTSTCTTFSSIDGFFDDKRVSGNTLYTIDGNEPGQYYATYLSNVADSNTPASIFPSYIAASYFECASNCASNVSCTGFEFKSDRTCIQHQALKSSNLVTDSNYTSYVLTNSLGYFQPANLS